MKRFSEISTGSSQFWEASQLVRLYSRSQCSGDRHFAVSINGSIVGYVNATRIRSDAYRLADLCVAGESRACGVGRMLLEETMERLAEPGIHTFEVAATIFDIDFYRRFGFETVGTFYEYQSVPHIQMRLERMSEPSSPEFPYMLATI